LWVLLGYWELMPCGLVLEDAHHWARGTPLRLVLAGHVWDWPGSSAGAAVMGGDPSRSHRDTPTSRAGRSTARSARTKRGAALEAPS
jgi:hypothetical protein